MCWFRGGRFGELGELVYIKPSPFPPSYFPFLIQARTLHAVAGRIFERCDGSFGEGGGGEGEEEEEEKRR